MSRQQWFVNRIYHSQQPILLSCKVCKFVRLTLLPEHSASNFAKRFWFSAAVITRNSLFFLSLISLHLGSDGHVSSLHSNLNQHFAASPTPKWMSVFLTSHHSNLSWPIWNQFPFSHPSPTNFILLYVISLLINFLWRYKDLDLFILYFSCLFLRLSDWRFVADGRMSSG